MFLCVINDTKQRLLKLGIKKWRELIHMHRMNNELLTVKESLGVYAHSAKEKKTMSQIFNTWNLYKTQQQALKDLLDSATRKQMEKSTRTALSHWWKLSVKNKLKLHIFVCIFFCCCCASFMYFLFFFIFLFVLATTKKKDSMCWNLNKK